MARLNVKDRLFLILGIALPFCLILFIWTARYLHQKNIPPPQFSFIYAVKNYGDHNLIVENNAVYLVRKYARLKKEAPITAPDLFLYDMENNKSQKVNYNFNKDSLINNEAIKISFFPNYRITTAQPAPDGYTFSHGRNPHAWFDLFGGYKHAFFLSKDGKRHRLNIDEKYYSVTFLGWLVPEDYNAQ